MDERSSLDPAREPTPPRFVLIALGTALAPFVVQVGTLLATQSTALTLLAGGLLAAIFTAGALLFQAREAGSWRAVPFGARLGVALAVVAYQVIAFPVAQIVNALLSRGPMH